MLNDYEWELVVRSPEGEDIYTKTVYGKSSDPLIEKMYQAEKLIERLEQNEQ